jgi:hypothetical protein
MFHKEILSAFAIALTLIAFLPYIRSIITGTVRPHVFSWVIWGTTTFVVFLAQLEDNAGAGAWPIGVSGTITILVAGLAYLKRGDVSITGADWFFLLAALSSLPFWYFTADPLWAVVILTIVDLFGFGPTIRKAYNFPQSESVLFFVLFMTRNILVLAALENYSLTTVLFPAAMAATCFLLILIIAFRRRVMIN